MKDSAAPHLSRRIYGLDILRASAILFVVLMHGLEYLRPHLEKIPVGDRTAAHYYWLFILDGVDLFFVLSGFLIGGILIRTINDANLSRSQLFNFWTRRWFRTLPNYFLILIVLLIGYRYAFNGFPEKTPQFFVFLQCFNSPHPHFFSESWSLAVEEWFYLLIPIGLFFLLMIGKNKRLIILGWIGTVLIGVTLFRIYKVSTYPFSAEHSWDLEIRKQVLTRMDSIMYGFLGAWLNHYKYNIWQKRKTALLIAGLVILFGSRILSSVNNVYRDYAQISVQAFGALCLLPKLNTMLSGKGPLFRALTFISIISYSMYLLNYTIISKVILPKILSITGLDYHNNILHGILSYALFWFLTISLSYLLYRLYERPMMDLRDRLKRKKDAVLKY